MRVMHKEGAINNERVIVFEDTNISERVKPKQGFIGVERVSVFGGSLSHSICL